MQFLIAETFTDSLARLTGEEQKAAKMAAFDLQMDPAGAGLSMHRLDKARDRNFWSARASSDLRLIIHRTEGSLLLCYVAHHDKAYAWAEKRKLETHPRTGAAQIVEVRETVQEIVVPVYVEAPVVVGAEFTVPPPQRSSSPVFAARSDDELLSYGVPPEWLGDVRSATEENLLALVEHLPVEAAEALLELATGGKPSVAPVAALVEPTTDPFAHPDAQRRFRVMGSREELEAALAYPWEKWTVFLHPEQRQWVERSYNGSARVAGTAGTGKTVVALHRAVYLARQHADARVLLTTFSGPLARLLQQRLHQLAGHEPGVLERVEVVALADLAVRLYRARSGRGQLATPEQIEGLLTQAASSVPDHRFTPAFLRSEWTEVVDAWQLSTWEAYRDVTRFGRKTRLPEAQRAVLWSIFEQVLLGLPAAGLVTLPQIYEALRAGLATGQPASHQFAVVDEAQDLGVAPLRFLAALGAGRPDSLFFAGDLGQRIFQQPFSWLALGVDVRGRSRTLRVNYRTSHQIRAHADRLLATEVVDADGNVEQRHDAISVFEGAAPRILRFPDEAAEAAGVGAWLSGLQECGVLPGEIGIFVRSENELPRARSAAEGAGLDYQQLDERMSPAPDVATLATMHLAKGLEFKAVAVLACDDEVLPLQERIASVGEEADLREVYDTERQLLYVACTRARDFLLVSGVEPVSEFLEDMG